MKHASPPIIRDLLRSARAQLQQALSDIARTTGDLETHIDPRLDAELLLAQVLGCERSYFFIHPEATLSTTQLDQFNRLVEKRGQGVPVAYLLGQKEFYGLALEVSPAVLIPRPETELLVDCALALIPEEARWTLADLGTGSGAIALALASQRPHCQVIATDRSPAALQIARRNAQHLTLNNVEFRCGDWLQPITETLPLIVSNPPYVAAGDRRLQGDSLRHEPLAALTPGDDGLGAVRTIIEQASKRLFNNGWLILEHGYDQADSIRALLRQHGYSSVRSEHDLSGHERISLGQWVA